MVTPLCRSYGEKAMTDNKGPPFKPEKYEEHKIKTAIIMSHFFVQYLSTIYREFKGDLAMAIVLGEIAHHNVQPFYSPDGECLEVDAELEDFEWAMGRLAATNAYSISEATDIPRETVRRKVRQLQQKGWVTRRGGRDIFISEKVVRHFTTEINKPLLLELLATSRCIDALLNTPESRAAGDQTETPCV
jgi:hypothetical protein